MKDGNEHFFVPTPANTGLRGNDPASSALLEEMKALLDDEEYENFVAAATRLSRSADFRFRHIRGVVGGVVAPSRPR